MNTKNVIKTLQMVKTVLKEEFRETAEADRFYSVKAALETLLGRSLPLIAVFPMERSFEVRDRSKSRLSTLEVHAAVMKKLKKPVNAEIDPLMEIAERIINTFYMQSIIFEGMKFLCKETEHLVITEPESIDRNVFISVVNLKIDDVTEIR